MSLECHLKSKIKQLNTKQGSMYSPVGSSLQPFRNCTISEEYCTDDLLIKLAISVHIQLLHRKEKCGEMLEESGIC
jgi:hypothetical protein